MTSYAQSVEEYLDELPEERRNVVKSILDTWTANMPDGFEVGIHYGMIAVVVPLSMYPPGYHCKKDEPLPFFSLRSQKNSVSLYHSGIYSKPELEEWFRNEWPKHMSTKLDMGKSCIRLKNMKKIPYELIAELAQKMGPQEWVSIYEQGREQA